jgi:hypothetical protein
LGWVSHSTCPSGQRCVVSSGFVGCDWVKGGSGSSYNPKAVPAY